MQAAPECGKRTLSLMYCQERCGGKTLKPADSDVEGSEALRLKRLHLLAPRQLLWPVRLIVAGHLLVDQVKVKLVLGRHARLCWKAAQRQGDVRLPLVSVQQQSIERTMCRFRSSPYRRGINVDRPQHIVLTPAVPFRKVSAFVTQGPRGSEEVMAKGGEFIHRIANCWGGFSSNRLCVAVADTASIVNSPIQFCFPFTSSLTEEIKR